VAIKDKFRNKINGTTIINLNIVHLFESATSTASMQTWAYP
jgi:hypothetical protein